MKITFLGVVLLLAFAAQAQAPATPVALKDEPHHHLMFENDYVRVWAFGITGHDATLLHNHDLPYFGIALGPADYVNAVVGKPETHGKLTDGQVSYSKGGFAHIVRTETDMPFRNFTIELLKPQANPRNRCVKVIADGALDCPQTSATPLDQATTLVFETDEVLLRSGAISSKLQITGADAQPARLVAVLEGSDVNVEFPGQPAKNLHGGEAAWLPAGATASLESPTGKEPKFVVITFKDSAKKK
jgi:hypothetical protein